MKLTARQFAFFRMILGVYLCIHFIGLLPYSAELFSNTGVLPEAKLNFTHGILPNILEHYDSPQAVGLFLSVLTLLAFLFAAGVLRPFLSIALWYGWACLFNRNNLISNPSIPYIGMLLLLCAIIPQGEGFFLSNKHNENWECPPLIWWTAWLLLMGGYTFSGVTKLLSPSWLDGSAMLHLLNNPLARPGCFRDWLLKMPDGFLRILTWTALAGEVLSLPLALWRPTRLFAWLWMLLMQIAILFFIDFADLTAGMLLAHLFTFDPAWVSFSAEHSREAHLSSFFRQTIPANHQKIIKTKIDIARVQNTGKHRPVCLQNVSSHF